jgi:hypothetical protein
MGFLSVIGKVLKVGEAVVPGVATAINPAAGAVISLVVNSVVQAEQTGGTGAAKKTQVVKDVLPAATAVINAVLQAKGTNVGLNSAQLNTAVGSLVDGVVALMNSVQTQPATQASTAPGSGAA